MGDHPEENLDVFRAAFEHLGDVLNGLSENACDAVTKVKILYCRI